MSYQARGSFYPLVEPTMTLVILLLGYLIQTVCSCSSGTALPTLSPNPPTPALTTMSITVTDTSPATTLPTTTTTPTTTTSTISSDMIWVVSVGAVLLVVIIAVIVVICIRVKMRNRKLAAPDITSNKSTEKVKTRPTIVKWSSPTSPAQSDRVIYAVVENSRQSKSALNEREEGDKYVERPPQQLVYAQLTFPKEDKSSDRCTSGQPGLGDREDLSRTVGVKQSTNERVAHQIYANT